MLPPHLGGHHGPTYPQVSRELAPETEGIRPGRGANQSMPRDNGCKRLHGEFDGVRLHHDGDVTRHSPNGTSDVVKDPMIRRRQGSTVGGLTCNRGASHHDDHISTRIADIGAHVNRRSRVGERVVQVRPQSPQFRLVGATRMTNEVEVRVFRQQGTLDHLGSDLTTATARRTNDGDVHTCRLKVHRRAERKSGGGVASVDEFRLHNRVVRVAEDGCPVSEVIGEGFELVGVARLRPQLLDTLDSVDGDRNAVIEGGDAEVVGERLT